MGSPEGAPSSVHAEGANKSRLARHVRPRDGEGLRTPTISCAAADATRSLTLSRPRSSVICASLEVASMEGRRRTFSPWRQLRRVWPGALLDERDRRTVGGHRSRRRARYRRRAMSKVNGELAMSFASRGGGRLRAERTGAQRIMRRSPAHARMASLVWLCLTGLSGCSNSPLWQYDKYDVRGALDGSSCRITVNGQPMSPDTTLPVLLRSVLVQLDYASNVGLPAGQGAKAVACNGVLISFAAPTGLLPTAGDYRVTEDDFDYRPGVVNASMRNATVGGGLWPFGGEVYLDGYEGTVHLDSMDRTRAWMRFEFRGRRKHGGE